MIAGIGLCELRELATGRPVKLSSVNDESAESGSVSADELGSGVNYDIRTVLKGTDQVRSSEGVINNKRNLM